MRKFMMIMLVGIVCLFAAHGVALAANVKYVVIVDNRNYTIEEAEDKGELFRDDRGTPVTDLNLARRIAQIAYVKERILTKKLFNLQQEITNIDTTIRMASRIAFLEAGRDLLARTLADCLVGGGIAGCVVPVNAPIQVLADTVKDPKVYLGSAAKVMARNAQNRYQRIVTEAERFLQTHKPLDDKTAAALYADYVWAVRENYPSVVLLGDLSGLNERWYQDLLKMGKVAGDEFLRLSVGSVGRIATADEIRRALQYGQRWLEFLHPGQRFIRNLQGQARMADQITVQIDRHATRAVRLATASLRAPQPQPLPVQPAPTAQQTQPGVPSSSIADAAQFVTDVTIPDGTMVNPGQSFTKTWRLRNTGTTTWGSGYRLSFVGGIPFGAPSTVAVPITAPGSTADVSIPMVAPSGAGPYQSSWQLANAQGVRFGQTIWVKVTVSTPTVVTPPQAPTPQPPPPGPAPTASPCPPFQSADANPFEPRFRGYCTWYAADRWLRNRVSPLPSIRDARYWIDDARDKGYQIGLSPVEGSLMVLGAIGDNPAGHVAYVNSVNQSSRTFTISEMNWGQLVDRENIKTTNFCKITERTLPIGQVPGLVGFIYPVKVSVAPLTGRGDR